MSTSQHINLDSIIKQALIQELEGHKKLPRRRLFDDIVYKYYLLRPTEIVDRWFDEWAKTVGK